MSDLVSRLRTYRDLRPEGPEAADRIEELEAKVERLAADNYTLAGRALHAEAEVERLTAIHQETWRAGVAAQAEADRNRARVADLLRLLDVRSHEKGVFARRMMQAQERRAVAEARVAELEADPRLALTVADLRDAYACVAWMVSQETPDITGLDGSAAERLRRAALAAEKGDEG